MLENFYTEARSKICVALDCNTYSDSLTFAKNTFKFSEYFKVGPDLIAQAHRKKRNIFEDLRKISDNEIFLDCKSFCTNLIERYFNFLRI